MRKSLLLFSSIIIAFTAHSQPIFTENFELPSGADSVASSGNPGWTINTTLAAEGSQSYHSGIAVNDASSFTTNKVDLSTATNVIFSFGQIAKVSPSDAAIIEVSNDSINWIQVDGSIVTYLGSGDFSLGKFTSASYPVDWVSADDNAIPDNTWWKYEIFDISSFAGFEIWFRFTVFDDDGNGSAGNYGWVVDDIKIDTSSCELVPPSVTLNPPILQGTVTGSGPYLVSADIFDLSGVLDATLVYTLNGISQTPITMTNVSGGTYEASIPGASVGSTICYQVEATDVCNNIATEPSSPNCFTISSVVPSTIDIGTGTVTNTGTSYPAPYGNFYWGARHQMIILASEMQAAGVTQAVNINSLAFDVVTPGAQSLVDFTIKIGHTTQTDMTSWVSPTQLTTVYTNPLFTESTGWNTHTFSIPFSWNGVDNIVVETCFNNTSWISNAVHNQTTTSFVSTRWRNADMSGVCSDTTTVSSTASQRPNMRLQVNPPQPFDAGVISINQPGNTSASGQSVPAEVTIRNYGLNPISNFDIEYTVDGVVAGNFTVSSTIAPSATASFTLPNFTVPVGLFTLCAYTSLSGDGFTANDTTCKQVNGIPTYTLNYATNFDSLPITWYTTSTSGATTWQLGTPAYGLTNSAHSAPSAWDINLSNAYTANTTAILYTPIFDIVNGVNAKLRFWQNRNTELDSDGFRLEYTFNGGSTWSVLGTANDQNAENWYNTANIAGSGQPAWTGNSSGWISSQFFLTSAFNNQQVQFRFVFTSNGFTEMDGVSIDDFSITEAVAEDLGVKRIISPGTQPAGASAPATIVVRNYGLNTINSFDVSYDIGSGPATPLTWSTPLAPGDSVSITIGNLTVPTGSYTFCAFTSLLTDGDNSNDTLCKSALGVPTITVTVAAPFSDNYDTTNTGWSPSTGAVSTTQWQLGTPAFGQTNSAYSAPNSWDINLSTQYAPNAIAYLTSPYFDFSNAVSPILSFYQNRNTQLNSDGARLEYSVSGGPWQVVGGIGAGLNWYNGTLASGTPGWSGNSNGWIESRINLPPNFNNQSLIQFRFVFTSDGFTNSDGISIDNFRIEVPAALSAATQNLTLSNSLLIPGVSQSVEIRIRNMGSSALDEVDVTLLVDGVAIVTDNIQFNPALLGFPNNNQIYTHTFSQPWIATTGSHIITVFTSNPNAGVDENTGDDTTTISVTVLNSTGPPFCDDFEGAQPPWLSLNALSYSSSTNWELGTPAQTFINSTFNGNNAWMIELSSNYGPRDSSGLFTPVFTISGNQCYKFSFQHIFKTELFQDGGTVEYSVDGTSTWKPLGSYNQPTWFNSQYIAALGNNPPRSGWSGQSNGWQLAENYIGFVDPQSIIFRFRFGSDMTIHDEGWAIDQFCFEEDPTNQCVLITDINDIPESSGLALDQNYPNPANNSTVISYVIPERGEVVLEITNLLGQQVKVLQSGVQDAGFYSVEVDLAELNSGIYYYSLTFNSTEQMVRKMVVVK